MKGATHEDRLSAVVLDALARDVERALYQDGRIGAICIGLAGGKIDVADRSQLRICAIELSQLTITMDGFGFCRDN